MLSEKEKPILFSTEMVRAILDGRKSMTRRVIKRGSKSDAESYEYFAHHDSCPYRKVGDFLWVREKLQKHLTGTPVRYFADGCPVMRDGESVPITSWNYRYDVLPSIFMPRWASRITLEVTGVRVQRLWGITPEDCIAEGLSSLLREHDACIDLCRQYKNLWDSINKKSGHGWDKNEWVWVIGFTVSKSERG